MYELTSYQNYELDPHQHLYGGGLPTIREEDLEPKLIDPELSIITIPNSKVDDLLNGSDPYSQGGMMSKDIEPKTLDPELSIITIPNSKVDDLLNGSDPYSQGGAKKKEETPPQPTFTPISPEILKEDHTKVTDYLNPIHTLTQLEEQIGQEYLNPYTIILETPERSIYIGPELTDKVKSKFSDKLITPTRVREVGPTIHYTYLLVAQHAISEFEIYPCNLLIFDHNGTLLGSDTVVNLRDVVFKKCKASGRGKEEDAYEAYYGFGDDEVELSNDELKEWIDEVDEVLELRGGLCKDKSKWDYIYEALMKKKRAMDKAKGKTKNKKRKAKRGGYMCNDYTYDSADELDSMHGGDDDEHFYTSDEDITNDYHDDYNQSDDEYTDTIEEIEQLLDLSGGLCKDKSKWDYIYEALMKKKRAKGRTKSVTKDKGNITSPDFDELFSSLASSSPLSSSPPTQKQGGAILRRTKVEEEEEAPLVKEDWKICLGESSGVSEKACVYPWIYGQSLSEFFGFGQVMGGRVSVPYEGKGGGMSMSTDIQDPPNFEDLIKDEDLPNSSTQGGIKPTSTHITTNIHDPPNFEDLIKDEDLPEQEHQGGTKSTPTWFQTKIIHFKILDLSNPIHIDALPLCPNHTHADFNPLELGRILSSFPPEDNKESNESHIKRFKAFISHHQDLNILKRQRMTGKAASPDDRIPVQHIDCIHLEYDIFDKPYLHYTNLYLVAKEIAEMNREDLFYPQLIKCVALTSSEGELDRERHVFLSKDLIIEDLDEVLVKLVIHEKDLRVMLFIIEHNRINFLILLRSNRVIVHYKFRDLRSNNFPLLGSSITVKKIVYECVERLYQTLMFTKTKKHILTDCNKEYLNSLIWSFGTNYFRFKIGINVLSMLNVRENKSRLEYIIKNYKSPITHSIKRTKVGDNPHRLDFLVYPYIFRSVIQHIYNNEYFRKWREVRYRDSAMKMIEVDRAILMTTRECEFTIMDGTMEVNVIDFFAAENVMVVENLFLDLLRYIYSEVEKDVSLLNIALIPEVRQHTHHNILMTRNEGFSQYSHYCPGVRQPVAISKYEFERYVRPKIQDGSLKVKNINVSQHYNATSGEVEYYICSGQYPYLSVSRARQVHGLDLLCCGNKPIDMSEVGSLAAHLNNIFRSRKRVSMEELLGERKKVSRDVRLQPKTNKIEMFGDYEFGSALLLSYMRGALGEEEIVKAEPRTKSKGKTKGGIKTTTKAHHEINFSMKAPAYDIDEINIHLWVIDLIILMLDLKPREITNDLYITAKALTDEEVQDLELILDLPLGYDPSIADIKRYINQAVEHYHDVLISSKKEWREDDIDAYHNIIKFLTFKTYSILILESIDEKLAKLRSWEMNELDEFVAGRSKIQIGIGIKMSHSKLLAIGNWWILDDDEVNYDFSRVLKVDKLLEVVYNVTRYKLEEVVKAVDDLKFKVVHYHLGSNETYYGVTVRSGKYEGFLPFTTTSRSLLLEDTSDIPNKFLPIEVVVRWITHHQWKPTLGFIGDGDLVKAISVLTSTSVIRHPIVPVSKTHPTLKSWEKKYDFKYKILSTCLSGDKCANILLNPVVPSLSTSEIVRRLGETRSYQIIKFHAELKLAVCEEMRKYKNGPIRDKIMELYENGYLARDIRKHGVVLEDTRAIAQLTRGFSFALDLKNRMFYFDIKFAFDRMRGFELKERAKMVNELAKKVRDVNGLDKISDIQMLKISVNIAVLFEYDLFIPHFAHVMENGVMTGELMSGSEMIVMKLY